MDAHCVCLDVSALGIFRASRRKSVPLYRASRRLGMDVIKVNVSSAGCEGWDSRDGPNTRRL